MLIRYALSRDCSCSCRASPWFIAWLGLTEEVTDSPQMTMQTFIFLFSIAALAAVGVGAFMWKQIAPEQNVTLRCMLCGSLLSDSIARPCKQCGSIFCPDCSEGSPRCPKCKTAWHPFPQWQALK